MVTIRSKTNIDGDSAIHFEFDGTSQDEIPTTWDGQPVEQNSIFHELDTGRDYYYDGQAWQSVGNGGGSGDMEWRTFSITGLSEGYIPIIPAYIELPAEAGTFGGNVSAFPVAMSELTSTFRLPVISGTCIGSCFGVIDTSVESGVIDSQWHIDTANSSGVTFDGDAFSINQNNAIIAFAYGGDDPSPSPIVN